MVSSFSPGKAVIQNPTLRYDFEPNYQISVDVPSASVTTNAVNFDIFTLENLCIAIDADTTHLVAIKITPDAKVFKSYQSGCRHSGGSKGYHVYSAESFQILEVIPKSLIAKTYFPEMPFHRAIQIHPEMSQFFTLSELKEADCIFGVSKIPYFWLELSEEQKTYLVYLVASLNRDRDESIYLSEIPERFQSETIKELLEFEHVEKKDDY